jgi:hypothetical protein
MPARNPRRRKLAATKAGYVKNGNLAAAAALDPELQVAELADHIESALVELYPGRLVPEDYALEVAQLVATAPSLGGSARADLRALLRGGAA